MKQTLKDINIIFEELTIIHCDNTSAISMSKNPVQHSKAKHIPIKFHYIREQVHSEREPTLDVRYPNVEMVDTEREPTPDVRYPNVEMVDTERGPTPDVRCTNVEKHTMDADFSTLDIHPSDD